MSLMCRLALLALLIVRRADVGDARGQLHTWRTLLLCLGCGFFLNLNAREQAARIGAELIELVIGNIEVDGAYDSIDDFGSLLGVLLGRCSRRLHRFGSLIHHSLDRLVGLDFDRLLGCLLFLGLLRTCALRDGRRIGETGTVRKDGRILVLRLGCRSLLEILRRLFLGSGIP